MREILFRGKASNRIDGRDYRTSYKNGDWVYGLLTNVENYAGFSEMTNTDGVSGIEVDKRTVGQFTGLTDKHGKKIFEGDIVKETYSLNGHERPIISVIEYGISYAYSNVCGVCQRFRDGSGVAMLSVGDESGVVYCEVIGNIHDNPELLRREVEWEQY